MYMSSGFSSLSRLQKGGRVLLPALAGVVFVMPAHAAPGDAEIVTTRIQLAQATAGTGATATTPLPTPIGAAATPAPAPAVTPIVQSRDSFWHAPLQQLPPLTSRPELYGQPQSLMLHPLTPIQLHQGPWGVFNANTGAASGFGTVGYYAVARWAEDWSSLRDKRNRHDFLDPLKYIALNDSGSIYLTLSGNFRHHGFWEQHPALGAVGKSHTYLSNLRTNLGADLHLGEHVRFYGELMSGQATGGNKFGYNARWRNRVDAQQAFVEVRGRMLGATMGAMVGRMSFLDVPPNISAGSVYPSIPYSWNGLRGYSVWKRFRVDLFDLSLTNYEYRAFHDQVGWKTRLFGAYTSYAIPEFKTFGKKSQIFVDTYYLGYLLASSPITATKGVVAGSTHRDTPGMRVWGNAGPIEFSASGMWQGGNFQAAKNGPTRPVSAYSFNASVAWRFANWWGRPAIGIQADDISGGDTRRSATSTWGGLPFALRAQRVLSGPGAELQPAERDRCGTAGDDVAHHQYVAAAEGAGAVAEFDPRYDLFSRRCELCLSAVGRL
ncbi:alginate export protein [Gluconacetobacter liquefaciens]|uniref:Alginate export protein n=1 Tax=Gluconacetobacter liquefaciens TaxID=89584 RepID=A0A370FYT3_GLULI|nr:alginate export protein [Gluconacetobacter liquefaciens]